MGIFMFPRFYKNIGFIRTVADGIATIVGLDLVRYGEMINFSNRAIGVVLSLENINVSAIILGSDIKILPGDFVFRSCKLMGVIATGALLSTIINPLGKSLSQGKKFISVIDKSKYAKFKELFFFHVDSNNSFQELLKYPFIFKKKFTFKNSIIKRWYVLNFVADFSKILAMHKVFKMFKDIKKSFGLHKLTFVKNFYLKKKLLNFFLDEKVGVFNMDNYKWLSLRRFQVYFNIVQKKLLV